MRIEQNDEAVKFVEGLINGFRKVVHREPTDQEINDLIEDTNRKARMN